VDGGLKMINIIKINHRDVSLEQLIEICQLKTFSWQYPIESQLEWIRKNISDQDIHVLLYEHNKLEAYLNLISIVLEIDNRKVSGFGIGNVCSRNKGQGFGRKLMTDIGSFLSNKNRIGLLFCNSGLTSFYSKFNWTIVDKSRLLLQIDNENFETMIYGCEKYFLIKYMGNQF
jgi:hypothetical protein